MDREKNSPSLSDIGRLRVDADTDPRLFLHTDDDEEQAVESKPRERKPAAADFEPRETRPARAAQPAPRPSRPLPAVTTVAEDEADDDDPVSGFGYEELEDEEVIETTPEEYIAARALVERKVGFFKLLAALVLANVVLASVSLFQVDPKDHLWFLWPLGLSVLGMLGLYIKVFLWSGLDLRSIIENRIQRMTEAELQREHLSSRHRARRRRR